MQNAESKQSTTLRLDFVHDDLESLQLSHEFPNEVIRSLRELSTYAGDYYRSKVEIKTQRTLDFALSKIVELIVESLSVLMKKTSNGLFVRLPKDFDDILYKSHSILTDQTYVEVHEQLLWLKREISKLEDSRGGGQTDLFIDQPKLT